jgi:hypothetical protein
MPELGKSGSVGALGGNSQGHPATLLKASRARRKVCIRKVMHHAPEVVREAPDHKLSPFECKKGTQPIVFGTRFAP